MASSENKFDEQYKELTAEIIPDNKDSSLGRDKINEQAINIISELRKDHELIIQAQNRKDQNKIFRNTDVCHHQLDEVIDVLNTTKIAFLVGPAGTGKSTLAKQSCSRLFKLGTEDPIVSGKYAQISFSPDTTSGEMIGRTDINGQFHESEIVRVFREGGVILFDEIDAADSSMLIKINTALANGYLATPTGMVLKNPNTYIVCAANTFGTGPDAMYVGRSRLDSATLDRFCLCTIYVEYDKELENQLSAELPEDEHKWLSGYTDQIRYAINSNKMRRICSTRFIVNATAHMKKGKTPKWVQEQFWLGWSDNEKKKVINSGSYYIPDGQQKMDNKPSLSKSAYGPVKGYSKSSPDTYTEW